MESYSTNNTSSTLPPNMDASLTVVDMKEANANLNPGARVAGIPEILGQILGHLADQKTIICCRMVSRTFNDHVRTSKSLQTIIFQASDPDLDEIRRVDPVFDENDEYLWNWGDSWPAHPNQMLFVPYWHLLSYARDTYFLRHSFDNDLFGRLEPEPVNRIVRLALCADASGAGISALHGSWKHLYPVYPPWPMLIKVVLIVQRRSHSRSLSMNPTVALEVRAEVAACTLGDILLIADALSRIPHPERNQVTWTDLWSNDTTEFHWVKCEYTDSDLIRDEWKRAFRHTMTTDRTDWWRNYQTTDLKTLEDWQRGLGNAIANPADKEKSELLLSKPSFGFVRVPKYQGSGEEYKKANEFYWEIDRGFYDQEYWLDFCVDRELMRAARQEAQEGFDNL